MGVVVAILLCSFSGLFMDAQPQTKRNDTAAPVINSIFL
jgi:hypothetical protein